MGLLLIVRGYSLAQLFSDFLSRNSGRRDMLIVRCKVWESPFVRTKWKDEPSKRRILATIELCSSVYSYGLLVKGRWFHLTCQGTSPASILRHLLIRDCMFVNSQSSLPTSVSGREYIIQ